MFSALARRPNPAKLEKDANKRFFDKTFNAYAVKIHPGEYRVSQNAEEMLVTVLGSCVSACVRDPVASVGGMNHFMLPESDTDKWGNISAAMRFGNFAMEQMINDILKLGGQRSRLEVKVFGGGKILKDALGIGEKNIDFIKRYCHDENLNVVASSLGGTAARRIHYFPVTGKVLQRFVAMGGDEEVTNRERKMVETLKKTPATEGDVELFI
jgi:chemotaxis protein CheD